MTKEDYNLLAASKSKMENIGLIMNGLNFVGNQIEKATNRIPEKTQLWLGKKVNSLLMSLVEVNLKTIKKKKVDTAPLKKTYKLAVVASGAGFGFFGALGFIADLTITTKFMMRSIMDIARNKGEDLYSVETQLACLEVFALGGKSKNDDGANTSYYATRMALKGAIKSASKYITENGIEKVLEKLLSGPPMMQFVGKIASRFEIQALEKFAADAPPIIGAAGGAAINLAFMTHFQNMAEAHFTIRQLERKYGEDVIQAEYEKIKVN
jgi:preprotein translocase subunit Sss1